MRKCQSATNVGNLCAGVLPWFTYKFPLYYRHTSLDEFSQFFCKNLALFRFEPHSLTISPIAAARRTLLAQVADIRSLEGFLSIRQCADLHCQTREQQPIRPPPTAAPPT